MSQTFTMIGIVGFSLAALLVLVAVIMYFGLHIKQVRDDLTGKTAARSIAEIRSRAKTRKRPGTQAAKRYGWEKDEISTDALKAAAAGTSMRAAGDTGPVDVDLEYDEDETSTTMLVEDDDEIATTMLVEDDDTATKMLVEEDDTATTNLVEESSKKPQKSKLVSSVQVFLASLLVVAAVSPALAWAEETEEKNSEATTPKTEESAKRDKEGDKKEAVSKESSIKPLDLWNDVTPPQIDAIRWERPNGSKIEVTQAEDPSVPLKEERRLHTSLLELVVEASDPDPDPLNGVDDDYSKVVRAVLSIGNAAPLEFTFDETRQAFVYKFDYVGIFDYRQFTINVYDEAGNITTLNMGSLTPQEEIDYLPHHNGEIHYKDFRINTDAPQLNIIAYKYTPFPMEQIGTIGPEYSQATQCLVQVEIHDADMAYVKTNGAAGFNANITDPWDTIVTLHSDNPDTPDSVRGINEFTKVGGSTSILNVVNFSLLEEDRYTASVNYKNLCIAEPLEVNNALELIIDRSAPYLTLAAWSSIGRPGTEVSNTFFTQKACLALDTSDIKLDSSGDPVDCGVAGVKDIDVTCLDSKGMPVVPNITRDPGSDTFKLYFEGSFGSSTQIPFNQILVSITDNAGNVYPATTLEDIYAGSLSGQKPGFDSIVVGMVPPEAGFSYNDNNLKNGIYLNRNAQGKVMVSDQYFNYALDAYSQMSPQDQAAQAPILEVWHRKAEGDVPKLNTRLSLGLSDFTATSDPDVWEADFTCSADGYYDLKLVYSNILGIDYSANVGLGSLTEAHFCIDTKNPTFGAVTITPTSPDSWSSIFAPSGANMSFALSDSLSGIDPQELSVSVKGEVLPSSYNEATGILSADIPSNDRRIKFSDVQVRIMDKAGNVPKALNLQDYKDKNIDDKTTQIIADAAAPVLTVTYDNNDAQNGHYYAAGRTATVTIIEASFDIVKEEDPYRVVATKTLGTSESMLYAKEFKNPSGDGVTWIAQIPCTTDGTYKIHAEFTDPAEKSADSFDDSFIVDTRAPLITISFDNNDSEGGGYFKATRTATIRIHEDNFSESLASITTQATDAGGASVAAPGASAWQQTKSGEWECSVHFGQELHYAMQVACTDLAGNEGKQAEEREFVIDMTAPIVNVERVGNYTAYADTIAPLVSFEDTNFEAFLCNVEITGANAEGFRYFMNSDTPGETSRVIDYQDFPYELEYDDVYTLHATIKDRAGNTAEQTVVFSFNRFGSNYTFAEQTRPYVGSYLKEAKDIVIIETNVSGLESSAVRMAQNDQARALSTETDYQLNASGSQTAWSQYTYTLPAALFENDAYYRVMLSSQDAAGNYSESLMYGKNESRDGAFEVNFVVDGTSPVASLSNIETNAAYYGPSQRLDVFMSDNIEAEQAYLVVNGARAMEWNAEDLKGDRAFSYDLPAQEDTYSVKVELRDKAGNSTTASMNNIMVTSDWSRYVLNTPAILYPMVAGVILVLGLAAILIARISLKKRNENRTALGGSEF